jgi:glutamyl-tRNA reductase
MPALLAPPPFGHSLLDGRRSPYAHVPTVPVAPSHTAPKPSEPSEPAETPEPAEPTEPVVTVEPVVRALRSKAAEVADAELGRLASRAPGLDASARDEVRRAIQRVVDAFLHEPITRVTRHADSPLGETYADALIELFSLDRTAWSPR